MLLNASMISSCVLYFLSSLLSIVSFIAYTLSPELINAELSSTSSMRIPSSRKVVINACKSFLLRNSRCNSKWFERCFKYFSSAGKNCKITIYTAAKMSATV